MAGGGAAAEAGAGGGAEGSEVEEAAAGAEEATETAVEAEDTEAGAEVDTAEAAAEVEVTEGAGEEATEAEVVSAADTVAATAEGRKGEASAVGTGATDSTRTECSYKLISCNLRCRDLPHVLFSVSCRYK